MRQPRYTAAAALAAAAILTLSACSSGSGSDDGGDSAATTVPTIRGEGKTITVWVMDGDYTEATLTAANTEFTRVTGAKVDLQIQQWEGITTKISTALSTARTPDILDLGNTQVPGYAAN